MRRRIRVATAAVVLSVARVAGGQSIFDDTWKPGDSRPPVTPGATTRATTRGVEPAGGGANVPADPGEAPGSDASTGTVPGAAGGTVQRPGSTGVAPRRVTTGVDLRAM